jgi:hypothetical protein
MRSNIVAEHIGSRSRASPQALAGLLSGKVTRPLFLPTALNGSGSPFAASPTGRETDNGIVYLSVAALTQLRAVSLTVFLHYLLFKSTLLLYICSTATASGATSVY